MLSILKSLFRDAVVRLHVFLLYKVKRELNQMENQNNYTNEKVKTNCEKVNVNS